eukprot:COSAG05_NODE_173_length_14969_cov_29.555884_8_plen_65_part_00
MAVVLYNTPIYLTLTLTLILNYRMVATCNRTDLVLVAHRAWIHAVNLFKPGARETVSRAPGDLI